MTLKYVITKKTIKIPNFFGGGDGGKGGQLFSDFRFSLAVLERNPREKQRMT